MREDLLRLALVWLVFSSVCHATVPNFWDSIEELAREIPQQNLDHFSEAISANPSGHAAGHNVEHSQHPSSSNVQSNDIRTIGGFPELGPSSSTIDSHRHIPMEHHAKSSSLAPQLPRTVPERVLPPQGVPQQPHLPRASTSQAQVSIHPPSFTMEQLKIPFSNEQRMVILNYVDRIGARRLKHPPNNVRLTPYRGTSLTTEGIFPNTFGDAKTKLWLLGPNLFAVRAGQNVAQQVKALADANMEILGDPNKILYIWHYQPVADLRSGYVLRFIGVVEGYSAKHTTEDHLYYRVAKKRIEPSW